MVLYEGVVLWIKCLIIGKKEVEYYCDVIVVIVMCKLCLMCDGI